MDARAKADLLSEKIIGAAITDGERLRGGLVVKTTETQSTQRSDKSSSLRSLCALCLCGQAS